MSSILLAAPRATEPGPINLTTRTGGDQYVGGANGADWLYSRGGYHAARKLEGGNQLFWDVFADSGALPGHQEGGGYTNFVTWNYPNDSTSATPGDNSNHYAFFTGINKGSRLSPLVADRNLRKVVGIVGVRDGTYKVRIRRVADNAVAEAIIATGVPQYSTLDAWFEVSWRWANDTPTTVVIDVLRSAGGAGDGYVVHNAVYLEVPKKPMRPRGARIFRMIQGAL